MSVVTEINRTVELTTNGIETSFDFSMLIHADTEIQVWYQVTDGDYTQLTLDTHYTVVFTEDGGTVTTIGGSSPYAAGKLLIIRHLALTQLTNWLYNDNHTEQTHQDDFDRSVMRDLQIQEQLDRAVGFAIHSGTSGVEFPEPDANKFIAWNAAGDGLENKTAAEGGAAVAEFDDLSDVDVEAPAAGDIARWTGAIWEKYPDSNYLPAQTIGIADNNLLEVDGTPNSGEYARFTVNGLEGRTQAEFVGDFSLEIGVDVQAWDTQLDSLANLTAGEVTQLAQIDAATISSAQWGYLGAADQGLGTGDSPTLTGLTLSGLTEGSVLFAGVGGVISEDNDGLFYDGTNLGVGTGEPSYLLDVKGLTAESAIRSDIGFDIYPVPDPPNLTGVVSADGSVDTGLHWYAVTYITAIGETHPKYTVAQIETTDGNNTVTLTIPVSTDLRVTGRKIYRTKAGEPPYQEFLLTTINNNEDLTYEDTTADDDLTGNLGIVFRRTNTTSMGITIAGTRSLTLDNKGTFVGYGAGQALTTGGRNVFIGQYAGIGATSAIACILIGDRAGLEVMTGSGNVFIGDRSGTIVTSGSYDIGIGYNSLANNISGSYNIAIGRDAGGKTTGWSNTFLGHYAGYANTSGEYGIHLGHTAGKYETAGDKLIIDSRNRTNEATQRTEAIIYGVMSGTAANQVLSLGGGGKVGFNELAPETLTEWTSTVPYLTLHNSTHENTDGGRESRIIFKGEKTDESEHTLAWIQASHNGTGDDQKGQIGFYTNDGSDNDAPTLAMTIDENQYVGIGTDTPNRLLHIYCPAGELSPLKFERDTVGGAEFSITTAMSEDLYDFIMQPTGFGAGVVFRVRKLFGDGGAILDGLGITKDGDVGFGGETDPETLTEWTHAQPYLTLHNDTHENSDGGRESRIIFKGEQSTEEETELAMLEVSHDGTGNDQLGKVVWSVNTGADVVEALRIDSDAEVTFANVATGVLPTAGIHLATKEYVDLALGAFKTFFLSDTGSGVGSLNYVYPHETTEGQSTIVNDGVDEEYGTGTHLHKGFITEAGEPATTTIHEGVISFHFHAKKGNFNQRTTTLHAILSKVDADGTTDKVEIVQTEISGELTDTELAFDIHAVVSADVEIASTTRLILDVYANVSGVTQDTVVTLYMEGTEDSYFTTKVDSGIWQNYGKILDDLNTLGQVGADSEFLVGTGAGVLAWESGATARTSLGLVIGTDVLANIVEDASPELGGELDAGAHTIGFIQQSTTGDGTTTINWTLGNKFYFTFGTQNDTFTFTAPSNPCNLILVLKQDGNGGGSRLATWPGTVLWPAGTAPTLSTGAGDVDIVSFYYDGTNYFGNTSKDFS